MKTVIMILAGPTATLPRLVMAGAVYQVIGTWRNRRRFPPPGRLALVNKTYMHICVTGTGTPTQVHLQHELESNNYSVFLSDNDPYIKVKRMVYLSGRSEFKTGRNNCAAQDTPALLQNASDIRA